MAGQDVRLKFLEGIKAACRSFLELREAVEQTVKSLRKIREAKTFDKDASYHSSAITGSEASASLAPKEEAGAAKSTSRGSISTNRSAKSGQSSLRRQRRTEFKNTDVKIEALYVADAHGLVPKLYTFGYDFKNWNEYWAVLNTGEVYLGLPHSLRHSFDYEQERIEHPNRFLKYNATGKKISGFDYRGQEVSFELGQEAVDVGGNTIFRRVDRCDNCKLDGTYRHEAYTDMVESANAMGLPGQTTFKFHNDGAFAVKGCTSDSCLLPRPQPKELKRKIGRDPEYYVRQPDPYDTFDDSDYFDYDDSGGSGKYILSGNQIVLKYDDGRTEEAFFFKYPGDKCHILSINGVNYFKQEDTEPPSNT